MNCLFGTTRHNTIYAIALSAICATFFCTPQAIASEESFVTDYQHVGGLTPAAPGVAACGIYGLDNALYRIAFDPESEYNAGFRGYGGAIETPII